jgi:succinate-semialdehyde dehydrogenase / glutarate-semialdehyde dehydrogenase
MDLLSSLRDPQLLRVQALVGGEWISADDSATFDVLDPATGQSFAQVARLGIAEAERAVQAAQAAFAAWSARSAKEREVPLKAWARLIAENVEDLAAIMTAEQGKPLQDARNEVMFAASFVEWFAEEGKRAYGQVIPGSRRDVSFTSVREPIGVAVGITPWNLPCAMVTRKAAPALAAGCTMVLKPAEDTPLTALALGALALRAGIPAGVFNVVTSDRAGTQGIGDLLTSHPLVGKLSFTGSTAVGKRLAAASAPTMKRVSFELGGNSPFIVCEDANLDLAVSSSVFAKFRNAGQTCIAPNRFFVHASRQAAFIERLLAIMQQLKQDAGTVAGVDLGPLISAVAVRKVESHVADALAKGATLLFGGSKLAREGNFFAPTLLTGVSSDMLMFQEETFGPVVGITTYEDEAQMLELANRTRVGLASYVFSRDADRIRRITHALRVGIVGVNTGAIATEVAPFGGYKESGVGREGGHEGLEEFMETKFICQAFSAS